MRPLSLALTACPPLSKSSRPLAILPPTLLAPSFCSGPPGAQGGNESTGGGGHTSLVSVSGPSPPGRGRLSNHHIFPRSFPLAQGLSEIQESPSFLSSFLGIKEFTVEMNVLVFRTQSLELGFALLLLKIDQEEEKKTKSKVAQVAGGKPSSNLRPREDGQRHGDGKVS